MREEGTELLVPDIKRKTHLGEDEKHKVHGIEQGVGTRQAP